MLRFVTVFYNLLSVVSCGYFVPWAAPHAYADRRWGNPALTQHNTLLEQSTVFCKMDKLWKGWGFRVDTWHVDSLTGRSGELVEALAERRMWMWHVSKKLGGEVLGVGSLVL